MPKTGREYHKKLGIKEPYNPFDERQARTIAEAILQDNLRLFDGDIWSAVTAYHSGPKNVREGKLGPQGRTYADKVFAALTGAR